MKKSEAVTEMEQISTYNGAKTETYNWSQSVQEVTVQLPLPEGTVSKQMDIKMQSKALSVSLKGAKEPLLKGDLSEKIKVDDSFWTIEDRKYLVLHL